MTPRRATLVGVVMLIGIAVYFAQPKPEPPYVIERNAAFDYDAMMASPHPVVQALRTGASRKGSSETELLAIQDPLWTEYYGRYRVFGFDPEGSYDSTIVCTLDGEVASAGTGSCLWYWRFFHNIPADVIHARHALDRYREIVAEDSTMEGPLRTSFESVHATLGISQDDQTGG